ncbi:MAG: iron uptake porin [Aphanizomenon sp.]|jgi:hypothetical protein|nr:iron uptake porin [Nostocales cyanobacterium LE14-WE12]
MKKAFWNILKVSPAAALILLAGNSAFAGEVNGNVTSVAELSQESNSLGQVTSVSQFSDVQPSDWAFKALQSLVERYRCVAGSPNGTFRGNRTLTRFEFAAALNACLDSINEILATATAEMVTKQDLGTLQGLQEEYSSELATIRGQVDALEARTGELEANQFSTTTKLSGEAIFSVSQVFGKPVGSTTDINSTTTLSDRVRLSLNSSFTGKDQLQTRLQGVNIIPNSAITGTNMSRLGHDGSATGSNSNNTVTIDKLNYAFNLSDKVRVKIDATGGELNENVNVFNPDFRSSGTGALSRYGRFSPIYRLADDGAGITVNVTPNDKLELSAAYFAAGRNTASSPLEQQGLFDGNNTLFGQLAFKPNKAINVGLTYAHAYRVGAEPKLFGDTGSVYANKWGSVADDRTESNNYGLQVSLQPSSKITLGGWAGYTTASTLVGTPNSAEMFYWATTLGVKDFLKEGNTLGFIFGQQPKLTGSTESGKSNFDALKAAGLEKSTSYHIEGLYKIKLSDNILITPGLLLIINPENNDKNGKELVGTVRTTFSF